MAKGRTISATELTEKDKKAINICNDISKELMRKIREDRKKDDFLNNYGRVHPSRDAGLGRAGGKLQRDAICTRGRTDKAPYSNRNLRWHPLIIAMETPEYASEIEGIEIDNKKLVFIIDGELWYPNNVHNLKRVYCAPFEKWYAIKDELIQWDDETWTNNSCLIPAMEYSTIEYSIETYAILGIAVVTNFYDVDPIDAYDVIFNVFDKYNYTVTNEYPTKEEVNEIIICPLCLSNLNVQPGNINLDKRDEVFQPPWRRSKREEGNAESLQLFHTKPLKESLILHTPKLVRYGHRWCNVAMADHSVDETVDFMKAIVDAHNNRKRNKT